MTIYALFQSHNEFRRLLRGLEPRWVYDYSSRPHYASEPQQTSDHLADLIAIENTRSNDLMLQTHSCLWKFGFGRHKGMIVESVPSDYLRWCLREIDDAPDKIKLLWAGELDRRKHEGVGTLDFGEGEDV